MISLHKKTQNSTKLVQTDTILCQISNNNLVEFHPYKRYNELYVCLKNKCSASGDADNINFSKEVLSYGKTK